MLNNQIPDYILLPFDIKYSERNYGDCRTKAFKQVLDNYSKDYSIQQIFGVGQGLAFAIQQIKFDQIALLGIQGRSFNAEIEFCKTCGVNCKEHYIDKNVSLLQGDIPFEIEILKKVATGKPVLIQCDIYYMSYLDREKRNHNERHMVTVIGYDLNKRILYVVDSLLNEITIVTMEEMYNAMFEKQYTEDKRGLWYSIEQNNEEIQELDYTIHRQSINQLGQRMLGKDGDLDTLFNYTEFLKRLITKSKEGSLNHIKYLEYIVSGSCYIVRQQDELNGSCFRTLYLQYISEVASIYNNSKVEFEKMIEFLKESEAMWKVISYKLRYSKENIIKKAQIFVEKLLAIYELEKEMAELMVKI